MAVEVFDPQVSVLLKKNIGRSTVSGNISASQRFQGQAREVDLGPWLSDQSEIVVRKSVRDPAGMFSITIPDKIDDDVGDSLYGAIEPLDCVDIRMARDTTAYAGLTNNMPMMMRGIVSRVSRKEVMTAAGPQRFVVITGQDYGKLLQMCRIYYIANMLLGQDLLTMFKLFVNFNIDTDATQDVSAFITAVMNGPLKKMIDDMRQSVGGSSGGQNQSPIEDILVDATVHNASVSPFGTNSWPGGTIYDLMRYFGDVGPWNELFIEDREDAPYLVFRPNPFKDPEGNYIQQLDNPPETIEIEAKHIISLEVSRSDEGIYNFYWTDMPGYTLNDGMLINAYAAQNTDNVYLKDYPNSTDKLYGLRLLETTSQEGPRIDGNTEGKLQGAEQTVIDFLTTKRTVVVNSNHDNVVFENGTVDMRGEETVRAGTILQITRGDAQPSEYYTVATTHTFLPFRSYRTTAELERGTGFIQRIQADGTSPYWSDVASGGVYA